MRALIVLLFAVLGSAQALALELGRGALPITFRPAQALALADGDAIFIEGDVETAAGATIALRLDDASSNGYGTPASRPPIRSTRSMAARAISR